MTSDDSLPSVLAINCAGLDPLGNLATPKEVETQIRAVRARNGQNSGNASDKYGGPGGI